MMYIEFGIGAFSVAIVYMLLRIEHRLTALETKMEVICFEVQKNHR